MTRPGLKGTEGLRQLRTYRIYPHSQNLRPRSRLKGIQGYSAASSRKMETNARGDAWTHESVIRRLTPAQTLQVVMSCLNTMIVSVYSDPEAFGRCAEAERRRPYVYERAAMKQKTSAAWAWPHRASCGAKFLARVKTRMTKPAIIDVAADGLGE